MADANVCENEMFVTIKWQGRTLDVPLVQLEMVDGDADTRQVIEDWHFWVHEYQLFWEHVAYKRSEY